MLNANRVIFDRNDLGVDFKFIQLAAKPSHRGRPWDSRESAFLQCEHDGSTPLRAIWRLAARERLAYLRRCVSPDERSQATYKDRSREGNLRPTSEGFN